MDYVEIPTYATRLGSTAANPPKPEPIIVSPLPLTGPDILTPNPSPFSPSLQTLGNLPSVFLSSVLQVPSTPVANPRGSGITLISTRDPLSLPITTVNFKRFTSNIGPFFWLQDRIEEILTWKKGWKLTSVWMAAYVFLCFFPRLVLLLPHALLIAILLATHPSRKTTGDKPAVPTSPPSHAREGSVDWQANLQGIQNLLGFVADLHDAFIPYLPYLTHSSPYTPVLFSLTLVSFLVFVPLVYLLPLRPTFLAIGLSPFFLTHPFTQSTLIPLFRNLVIRPYRKAVIMNLRRFADDDTLEDKHWRAEVKQVELYENERWSSKSKDAFVESSEGGSRISTMFGGGWGKNKLRPGDRKAWTRGRDGWSGISDNGTGDVSNLTFPLESGWSFIETEDWRPDLEASWISAFGADDNGWVYTNDAWSDPKPWPSEEWILSNGSMTRRRRWTRRIYYACSDDQQYTQHSFSV